MSQNISFDPAVEYYDRTRGLAEGVAEQIRDAIVNFTGATKETRFLEPGVGTGRIAIPFIQAGYNYTGVDISKGMMNRMREKLGPSVTDYKLYEADIKRMPFADGSFDVAIAVHVFHLIEDWQAAILEARRVLAKPNGWLLIAQDAGNRPKQTDSPAFVARTEWDRILSELGHPFENRGGSFWREPGVIVPFLEQTGATASVEDLVEHQSPPLTIREMAERHMQRMYSGDWRLPEDVHREASRRLQDWLNELGSKADEPHIDKAVFRAIAARWPS